jgi:hypothetical protein
MGPTGIGTAPLSRQSDNYQHIRRMMLSADTLFKLFQCPLFDVAHVRFGSIRGGLGDPHSVAVGKANPGPCAVLHLF